VQLWWPQHSARHRPVVASKPGALQAIQAVTRLSPLQGSLWLAGHTRACNPSRTGATVATLYPQWRRCASQTRRVGARVLARKLGERHQPRDGAPRLRTTSAATFVKLRTHAAATCLARAVATRRRTRCLNAILPSTGRRAVRSCRSMARKRMRTHDQNFSTGFRSGDLAGNFHKDTLQRL